MEISISLNQLKESCKDYIPKEISWFSFNERVLQEIENPEVPLLARFIYDRNIPGDFLKVITKKLHFVPDDVIIPRNRYHNLSLQTSQKSPPKIK